MCNQFKEINWAQLFLVEKVANSMGFTFCECRFPQNFGGFIFKWWFKSYYGKTFANCLKVFTNFLIHRCKFLTFLLWGFMLNSLAIPLRESKEQYNNILLTHFKIFCDKKNVRVRDNLWRAKAAYNTIFSIIILSFENIILSSI